MKPVVMLTDANVFLRFLRNDHPQHSPAARQMLEAAAAGRVLLQVPEIVVADIFYTLTAPLMKIPRAAAARQLAALLQRPGIDLENRHRVFHILTLCETRNVDYGDAALMVAAQDASPKLLILTYDQNFTGIPGLTAFSPIDWLQKGHQPPR